MFFLLPYIRPIISDHGKNAFFSFFLFVISTSAFIIPYLIAENYLMMHGKISVVCLKKIPLHVASTFYLYAAFFSLSGGCGLWLFNGSPGRGMQRYDARTSTQTSGQAF
jgi:hypothetical protein